MKVIRLWNDEDKVDCILLAEFDDWELVEALEKCSREDIMDLLDKEEIEYKIVFIEDFIEVRP